MKNWDAFVIVSTSVIALALFSSGKINATNMLDNLSFAETLLVMAKTIAVIITGSLTIALMVIILVIDILISVIMQVDFPIMHLLYEYLYLGMIREWFWDAHTGSHILMATIVLFGIGLINTYLGPVHRKKTFIYYKNKESNYFTH
ncbi:MAG: hypothetical protein ACOC12_04325 [Bacteroidota bacterium]